MTDTRHKNEQWRLNEKGTKKKNGSLCYSLDTIQTAILMDIRDELRDLNHLLRCPNFIGIPTTLQDIKRNTTKPRRKKK